MNDSRIRTVFQILVASTRDNSNRRLEGGVAKVAKARRGEGLSRAIALAAN